MMLQAANGPEQVPGSALSFAEGGGDGASAKPARNPMMLPGQTQREHLPGHRVSETWLERARKVQVACW